MRYFGWSALYEGTSDALYLDVLIPRVIRDIVATRGLDLVEVPDVPAVRLGSQGRSIERVATEACSFRDAYDVLFIHADTGGRGLEQRLPDRSEAYCAAMVRLCGWPADQCVTVTPRHETEAWLLADGRAVIAALGYNGHPAEVGLPADAGAAERLPDPKRILSETIEAITGRRRRQPIENVYAAIGQRQDLAVLRGAPSFVGFEERLGDCLRFLRLVH